VEKRRQWKSADSGKAQTVEKRRQWKSADSGKKPTAATLPRMSEADPVLLPVPRQLIRHGSWCAVPAMRTIGPTPVVPPTWQAATDDRPWLTVTMTPLMAAQAYTLHVTAHGCQAIVSDAAGVRHAAATLAQLVQQYGARIPTLTIHDQPLFAVRGVMLDVSRDRIPTMAEFQRLIPQLAAWKYNHLQLYVEHTVAYAGHAAAWQGLDPLTPDELRTLDQCCADHGIELAANQNCFGHLSGFLAKPPYQHLAEIAVDGTWDFNGLVTRRGPFSLCPGEPAARTFVADLLAQLCPLLRSPWLNIGCDETFDVGQGRSREAVAHRGRAAVYLDFVREVCALAATHGKRPQFWADIALEHPECLRELPPVCGLAWGYEGDAQFAQWCTTLRAAGHAAWVCPGTSSWRSITGRTTDRGQNLLAAAEQGAAHGASGFLVTDWGDLGHRQQWPISLHGLAEAAHRAWSGNVAYDSRASGLHGFGNADVGPWLDALGDADRSLRLIGGRLISTDRADGKRAALRNATALFTDLHLALDAPYVGSGGQWQEVDATLAQLQATQPPVADTQLARELALTLRMARIAAQRAIARRHGDRGGLRALAGTWRQALQEQRALWALRSRTGDDQVGGLATSCAHDLRLIAELEQACV
jgi:hypothetical protein